MLQAESEKLRHSWIQAVQASIASAYRESPDTYYIEVSPSYLRTVSIFTVNQHFGTKCLFAPKFD